ncbi:MAG: response regulator [Planctomycetes bacterium]|nr:response regulator [Planctomycetota bacterium]
MEKILVVDDDVAIRDLLYRLLNRYGYAVDTSVSGEDALLKLRNDRPDLIILDHRMPGLSGLDLLREIRRFDPAVDIIMLTGFGTEELERDARVFGVTRFLQKGLSIESFMNTIEDLKLKKKPASAKPKNQTAKIMIVDDDPEICSFLGKFLMQRGYTVDTASCGEEALDKIKADRPDLVLLDVNMPGMDGLLALKKIKALDRRINVMIITGDRESGTIDQALNLGAFEYIMKPFNLEYLDLVVLTKIFMADGGC